MFENLRSAMDLSHASMCLLRCVGPLRTAGAESATLIHVMTVRNVGGLYISRKNLVEPLLKGKEKELAEMGFQTRLEIPLGDPAYEINRVAKERDASLIVAGTHGESHTKEILLGSGYGVQGGGVRPTGPLDRGEDPERELQHSRHRRPGEGVQGGGFPGAGVFLFAPVRLFFLPSHFLAPRALINGKGTPAGSRNPIEN